MHQASITRMISSVPRSAFFVAAFACILSAASCNDDTTEATDDGAMHITLPDDDLTLLAGTAGTVRVVIVRNGYDKQITLRAEGVPSGVTAPEVFVTKEEAEADIVFTATNGATPGNTDVTILAEGDSAVTSFRILRLSIRPPGSFSLTAEPIALLPATSASATVNVNRVGGFNGVVTLSVSAPIGLTASVQPTELAGSASNSLLTIVADRALRPGAYTVRLTGSSPGFVDETIEITVTVAGS